MIRHDDKSKESIAFLVKTQPGFDDDSGRFRAEQNARAESRITKPFETPAAFDGLFFGRKGFQLEFEPFQRLFGKRIRQAISDVLDGAGRIEVREVASRPPPILNRPSIFGVFLAALGPPRPSAGW